MIRTHLGRSRVRESRTLGSVGAKPNGLATRPSPPPASTGSNRVSQRPRPRFGARQLAQPNQDALLDPPAQGADAGRFPLADEYLGLAQQ